MNIIQRTILCGVLISFVTVKQGSCDKHIVAGYAPGVSGMPPVNKTNCRVGEILKNPSLSIAPDCARTCHVGDKPRTCYYKFVLERYPTNGQACQLCTSNVTNTICPDCQCVRTDGVARMALTVNRMIPGPSIQVCRHDYVVIDVENKIQGESTTIHWHGVYQKGSQYCDGVPQVTQCGIEPGTTFRYQFRVKNSGTHFWHAHSGVQKLDGIFGSFVVREPIERDPHRHLFDYDLANHVVVINDWMHEGATERIPGRETGVTSQGPDTFLINGNGLPLNANFTGNSTAGNATFSVITVEANKRYRFRLVNAFCTLCPSQLMIEDHNMTAIASDGQNNKPVVVNSIISLPGERYDFILHTDKKPGTYWIQLRGLNLCRNRGIHQLALLQYLEAPKKPKSPQPTYNTLPSGIILNPVDVCCNISTPNLLCMSNLTHAEGVDRGIVKKVPDIKLYMPIGFRNIPAEQFYRPNNYDIFLVPVPGNTLEAYIDNIQYSAAPSPPISQYKDNPPGQFCNSRGLPGHCNVNCTCTHLLKIPLNAVVEIILIDRSGAPALNHPFHLHGHSFRVLSMGQPLGPTSNPPRPITVEYVKQLEKETNLERKFDTPAGKDTLTLPNNGYVVIRFRADNPGFWLFHCHFVYHQDSGMQMIFQVGKFSDLPPVPKNFPRCGNFKLPITPNFGKEENKGWGGKKEKRGWQNKDKKKEWAGKEEKKEWRGKEEMKEWEDKEEMKEWEDKEEMKEWEDKDENKEWEDKEEMKEWGGKEEKKEWEDKDGTKEWVEIKEKKELVVKKDSKVKKYSDESDDCDGSKSTDVNKSSDESKSSDDSGKSDQSDKKGDSD